MGLAALAACGGDSSAGEEPAGDSSPAETAGPETAETEGSAGSAEADVDRAAVEAADPALNEPITIALAQLPRKFDPLDDLEPWALRIADDLVFEGLVRRTHDGYPWAEPALADRCEVDREYAVATVTCHIPRGIRFHDGSELTMEDVEYSLSYWLHPHRSWIRQRHGLATLER
ncbi:MAG: hypothetical protein KC431_31435, partial [Myxococcales bacterium]|nr:hypothetical protein [Myxococcales bacterium]